MYSMYKQKLIIVSVLTTTITHNINMYIPVYACICVCMNAGADVQTHYVMYHKQKALI